LIRAVTILAGEQPTSREEAINVCEETRDAAVRTFGETSSRDGSFSGDLVKVLIEAFVRGTKNGALPTGEGVRAILSELASAPIELPSQSQIVQAMRDEIRGWGPEKAVEFTRKRIAHFLIARDIEIKEAKNEIESLKNRLTEQSAMESRLHVVLADHGLPTGPKALAAELASRARAIEEDARRIDSLVRASADLATPITIDGKTPGLVAYMAYKLRIHRLVGVGGTPRDDFNDLIDDEQSAWSECANAVLRAFGQPSQATQDAADALRRVRSFAERYGPAFHGMVMTINDELAKLEAEPPSVVAKPKFFFNENELRGSYFCTDFPFRPHLHVGRDIEFDDIPRLLKLGLKDVIEVRVVERAER
jgi:hypothetical protein